MVSDLFRIHISFTVTEKLMDASGKFCNSNAGAIECLLSCSLLEKNEYHDLSFFGLAVELAGRERMT